MSSIDQTGCLTPQSRLQGRYIIRKTIGEGGMGSVYKAIDTRARNRLVAIKELNLSHYQSPAKLRESEKLFRREAEILSNLSHPNLPRVYAFFNENGRSYLVMDFIRGKTLAQLLTASATKRLPTEEMLDYALQLCDALSYLHQQTPPIIFRDLKPGNVMITTTGNLFLIDFGIARIFKQGELQDTQRFGTPGFASPEHYGSGQTGPRSDLYSLGATLYYCLTGKDPRENQPTLFHFLPAHEYNSQIPLNLSELIQRLVATSEDQRPPDAQAVQDELLAIGQQLNYITPNIASSHDPQTASAPQLSSQTLRHTRQPKPLASWSSTIVLLANIYAMLCTWFSLTVVQRSKQLHRNSISTISSRAKKPRQSLFFTAEARSRIRDVWTPHFTLLFILSAIAMISGSLYMLIILHCSVYLIAFYLCLFLLLHLATGYSNRRIRHPLAHNILTTLTLLLSLTAIAISASSEMRPIIQVITLNQLLSTSIVVLVLVSLLRPKERFGWVDHICLAIVAATYAFLLSSMGIHVQQQWLSIFTQLVGISLNKFALPVNFVLICILCIVTLIELLRYKYPFTVLDHLQIFIVALIIMPLQFLYSSQELSYISLFISHTSNTFEFFSSSIYFNILLTGIPVAIALLWIFIAPNFSYLSRLSLLPLTLACAVLQSFLGPITYLPLLKPSFYPLAHPLAGILHLNQFAAYGLALIIGILLYRWQHPFTWLEQSSLFYTVIVCTLLQNAAWNINNPFTLTSVLLLTPQATTIPASQFSLLTANKFLALALLLLTIAALAIPIVNMFLLLARDFAWIDRQIVRIKQRFAWLNKLTLLLNHLMLLIACIICIFLLFLNTNNNMLQSNLASSFDMLKQLTICFLLIASLATLIRILRPFNATDRWTISINAIACFLVLWAGKTQQVIMHNHLKITSIKPWLADPHIIVLPSQTILFGLLLTALVSLMWVRRRIPRIYHNMLKIGFGLTFICALLQWFNPTFLLASLIMLTLSILLAIQVEQI